MPIPGQILDPNRRNPTSGFADRVVKGFVDNKTPLFSGSAQPNGGSVVNKVLDDPTYLGFSVYFDFVNSPLLFVSDDNALEGDYAYKYLSEVSPQRAELLKIFVNSLQYLQNNKPYVFQTIEGLDRCWNIATDLKDAYMGGDEAKIGITCLESVDMRMTALMDLYRKIVFDTNGRREIVPKNLRMFKCTIIVQEIRRFKTLTDIIRGQQDDTSSNFGQNNFISPTTASGLFNAQTLNLIASGDQDDPISLWVNDNCSQVVFNLDFCEFMPEAASVVFTAFNNAGEKTPNGSKIGFTYEKVSEVNRYATMEGDLSSDNLSRGDKLGLGRRESALQAASRRVLASLAGAVKSRIGDAVINKAKQMGIKNPLGALNTVSTLLSADGVVRFGESLLTNAVGNLTNRLGRGLGANDVFAGQRRPVNSQLPDDVRVYGTTVRPNEVIQERLDPLSSNTLSSQAFQPTNFNGQNQPALSQENLIGVAVQNPNFTSYRAIGSGAQPGPLVAANPIGAGDQPGTFSSTNTIGSGSQPGAFSSTNTLGVGSQPGNFSSMNTLGSAAPDPVLSQERIMPAAYRPTNNDGSNPPQLSKSNILGAGGPPGPVLTSENIF